MEKEYRFDKKINSDQLFEKLVEFCEEVNILESLNLELLRIETVNYKPSIWFNNELSPNALLQLNELISNYILVENYIPTPDQEQINKLIDHIHNPDLLVSNLVIKIIMLNLAPKLGPEIIETINSQIDLQVGSING